MNETYIRIRNTILSQGYKRVTKPLLFTQDPEKMHDHFTKVGHIVAKRTAGRYALQKLFFYEHPMLHQTIAGIDFKNPVGLAAGFDKNANLTQVLPEVGFGFAELGSITGEPCAGNPKPRLWRLVNARSINVYYGLKNDGAEVIAARLQKLHFTIPFGISAAKTNCQKTVDISEGIADYCKVLEHFKTIGAYYTINISCPNSFGGLDFSDPERLEQLFKEIKNRQLFCKPVFLKLSPDITTKQLDKLIELALKYELTGMICSNLIKKKENVILSVQEKEQWIYGGVSGKPIKQYALQHCQHIFKKTKGKLIIIGCGGIFSAQDVYDYIKNGASLVQLITGMIYEGPQLISQINQGLVNLLKQDRYTNIHQAIGKNIF